MAIFLAGLDVVLGLVAIVMLAAPAIFVRLLIGFSVRPIFFLLIRCIFEREVLESVEHVLAIRLFRFYPLRFVEMFPKCLHQPFLKPLLSRLIFEP